MNSHDNTDRQTLSALFDGALQGDARRFASRRLAHDTAWQEDCGRWQLIGDAMRRQAPIVAPADFAARVERAIAAEPAMVSATPVAVASTRRPVRLWAGGAVAASLAVLAVFATHSPQAVDGVAPPVVASSMSASPASAVAAPVATIERTPPAVASTEPAPGPAPSPIPQEIGRVAAVEPASRPTVRRASPRAVGGSPAVVAPQRAAGAVLAAATFTPPDATNPFHVPAADALASRPWPRAAISAGGALTASYGTQTESRGDSPSFYPFEPRNHGDAAVRTESP